MKTKGAFPLVSVLTPIDIVPLFTTFAASWFLIPEEVFRSIGISRQWEPEMLLYLLSFLCAWYLGYVVVMRVNPIGEVHPVRVPSESLRLLRNLARISLCIGAAAFSVAIARMASAVGLMTLALSPGVDHASYYVAYGQVPGITTFSQMIPVGFILFAAFYRYGGRFQILDVAILCQALLVTAYRGWFLERTALMEVIIPIVVVLRSQRRYVSIVSIVLMISAFLLLYSTGELVRNFERYAPAGMSWIEYGLFRLGQYVASVFYYFFNLSKLNLPVLYGQALFRWLTEALYRVDPNAVSRDLHLAYGAVNAGTLGIEGYTTFTVAGEYYIDGRWLGVVYAFGQSCITTWFYKDFLRQRIRGLLCYPVLYTGSLFIWYVSYINRNRGMLILLCCMAVSSLFYLKPLKRDVERGLS